MNVQVTARRLRVFRYVKEHMELHGECPTSGMVAEALGIFQKAAEADMRALRNADGLPMQLNDPASAARVSGADGRRTGGAYTSHDVQILARGAEPIAAPVDLVMRERRAIPAWAAGDE